MSDIQHSVRRPAVAGLFYPGEARELAGTLERLLSTEVEQHDRAPKALIAPHAGYIYSGPTAAQAYACLASVREQIRRVVLLGPTHRVAVRGLALPAANVLATPLGNVEVDRDAVDALRGLPQVMVSEAAHALEHSLEVHLPFLQTVLSDWKVLPLAVGHVEPEAVAEVLERVWGGPETLIVVSSDLSHFLPYRDACAIDRQTCDAILSLSTDLDHDQACGATPVAGLVLAARNRSLRPALLDLRNSGDTAGDKSRVVGYASFAFYESA